MKIAVLYQVKELDAISAPCRLKKMTEYRRKA